jgi:ribosomal protein L40E
MGFPIFPVWLSPLILIIAVSLIALYGWLYLHVKTERCVNCGTLNAADAMTCSNCRESTLMEKAVLRPLVGIFGMILGFAPLMLLLFSAQNYPDPPVPELISSGIGIIVFIVGFVTLVRMPMRRVAMKQKATVLRTNFYGGYCAKCGTEILGGVVKCPKCEWKVNSEKPNWAIASKNGKTGLPIVNLRIICNKCKTANPASALKCQKCKADLLAFKPFWQRVLFFVFCVLVSLGTGWIVLRALEDPNIFEGLDAIGFGVISLTLITIVMPFYGLYLAFSGGKLPELLTERAGRHLKENPWQALEDYGHALELAAVGEHAQIMINRMKVYQSLGLEQNATREELAITYARERNPQGGFGLFMAGNIFGDSFSQGYLRGISKQARKDREKMYSEGRVIVLGYCPVCKQVVELNGEFKCPNSQKANAPKHSGKPKFLQYVVAADVEAGKIAVMKSLEAGKRVLRNRIVTIVMVIVIAAGVCGLFNYLAGS